MEPRLMISTFFLIFLAELGDKTQLAAFAASAGSRSPWSIFAGASLALVTSTLIAVLVGSTLHRFVPVPFLKIGAAVLFIVFGILLLIDGIKAGDHVRPLIEGAKSGVVARLALGFAADFEKAAAADYRAIADAAADPELKALLRFLADEEDSHFDTVAGISAEHGSSTWAVPPIGPVAPLTSEPVMPDRGAAGILAKAVEHERATAAFYESLAGAVLAPSLKNVFTSLAAGERGHAERLAAHTGSGTRPS